MGEESREEEQDQKDGSSSKEEQDQESDSSTKEESDSSPSLVFTSENENDSELATPVSGEAKDGEAKMTSTAELASTASAIKQDEHEAHFFDTLSKSGEEENKEQTRKKILMGRTKFQVGDSAMYYPPELIGHDGLPGKVVNFFFNEGTW